MRAITIKSIETKTHPETKRLFWFIFGATRGGMTLSIIQYLRKNQILGKMRLSYVDKNIQI